jgi:hypothetical protein
LRPEANLGAVTVDDYKAPVIASWQAGLGRVLCYTGEADGANAGPIAKWKDAGELFTSIARWTAGETNTLPGNLLVTEELRNGVAVVQLHLDPERDGEPFNELPRLTILRGVAGSTPQAEKTALRWTSADTLEAEIPLRGNETTLATVEVAGAGRLTLSPVCLPYSPEFKPVEPDSGVLALENLGKATGGHDRANLASVWKDLPRQPRMLDMTTWLLAMALSLLLLEVLERRTGMLSLRGLGRMRVRKITEEDERAEARVKSKRRWVSARQPNAAGIKIADATQRQKEPVATVEAAEPGLDDALLRARRRASARTKSRGSGPRQDD